jgi:hypothetical protein
MRPYPIIAIFILCFFAKIPVLEVQTSILQYKFLKEKLNVNKKVPDKKTSTGTRS